MIRIVSSAVGNYFYRLLYGKSFKYINNQIYFSVIAQIDSQIVSLDIPFSSFHSKFSFDHFHFFQLFQIFRNSHFFTHRIFLSKQVKILTILFPFLLYIYLFFFFFASFIYNTPRNSIDRFTNFSFPFHANFHQSPTLQSPSPHHIQNISPSTFRSISIILAHESERIKAHPCNDFSAQLDSVSTSVRAKERERIH